MARTAKIRRQSCRSRALLLEPLESRTLLSVTSFTLSTLYTFNNETAKIGLAPDALTRDAAGNIFGTTSGGGARGYGTIFEIPIATKTFTVLAQFNSANGFGPTGPFVVDAADNIFGAATNGGAYNKGALYELAAGTSTIVNLYSFSTPVGTHPFGGLTADKHGNLFGTTYDGAGPDFGTVFKFSMSTHTLTVLHIFTEGEGGKSTGAITVDPSGNLYGTTYDGGFFDDGTVFKISAGSNYYGIIASFSGNNGSHPTGQLLRDAAGSLYGVTTNGGAASNGAAYVIPAGSNIIYRLASFAGATGIHPVGGLVPDATGDLFGVTAAGASNGTGTAYVIPAGANFVLPLATFTSQNVGTQPSGGLILTRAGNLIGTTSTGGTHDDGILFQLTAKGVPATGWIDIATAAHVQGWAYDPAAGTAPIKVALYIDHHLINYTTANLSRPNLAGVVTNGTTIHGAAHAFNIDISSLNLAPGNHIVQVYAISSTGGVVNPLLRTVTIANVPPVGYFDVIQSDVALGWAYDPSLGSNPVTVKILVDGSLLTTTVANTLRNDVNGAVIKHVTVDGANHGFSYNLSTLAPGTHTITLLAEDPGQPDVLLGTKVLSIPI